MQADIKSAGWQAQQVLEALQRGGALGQVSQSLRARPDFPPPLVPPRRRLGPRTPRPRPGAYRRVLGLPAHGGQALPGHGQPAADQPVPLLRLGPGAHRPQPGREDQATETTEARTPFADAGGSAALVSYRPRGREGRRHAEFPARVPRT